MILRVLAFLGFALLASMPTHAAMAQGCGENNPNCIVPTRPAGDNTNAAASTKFVQTTTGQILTNPTLVGDDITVNPASRQQGTYIEFYSPYFAGITGSNPSGSFGVQFLEYGKVNGTGAQTLVANINPGASICTTTSNCSGDIDLDVWDGFDQVLEVYSIYATASGNPGGIQPGAPNRNVLGSANYTWKWVFADTYYVQDATLALIQLNSTTANQTQEILFKNATNNTFAIIAAYSGGNYFSVYDNAKGGNIIFAAANGGMSISPGGALTLAPASGGLIYNAPTGTPTASLCLDAGGNIIKKTTAGSCI